MRARNTERLASTLASRSMTLFSLASVPVERGIVRGAEAAKRAENDRVEKAMEVDS